MRPNRSEPGPAAGKRELAALGSLLFLFSAAVLWRAWTGGITADEPSHLVSAHVYWRGGQTLAPRDMPPLIRIVGGWVTRVYPLPLPEDLGRPRDARFEWDVAYTMMDRMQAPWVRKAFFLARASLLPFSFGILVLVWWWGRELWGSLAGVAAAATLALEPTFRGHASLYKNDIAAAFGYLLFWYAAWRYWKSPCWRRAAWIGAAAALSVLAKLSMLILVVLGPLIVLAGALARRRPGMMGICAATVMTVAVPYAATCLASAHEVSRLGTDHVPPPGSPALQYAHQVFTVVPVAVPMWEGIGSLVLNDREANNVFLMGEAGSSPWYFVTLAAVKMPLGVLALVAAGVACSGAGLVVALPGVLYVMLASLSSLQYGLRLVLPAFPFLALAAGAGFATLWSNRWRPAGVILALAALAVSVQSYPHDLSFFNVAAGGPAQALRYAADSNVDWGQGLPDLLDYYRRAQPGKMRVFYFGTDNLFRYFTDREIEHLAPPWSADLVKSHRFEPAPGVYAVSATLLPGHMFAPEYRDYFQVFRQMRPVARPGNSIYVYRVEPGRQ